MPYFKPKFSWFKPQKLLGLAGSFAWLSQIALPLPTVAEVRQILAKSSQIVAEAEQAEPDDNTLSDKNDQAEEVAEPSFAVKAVITAYTSTPDQTDDSPFVAASGKRVYPGLIAVNGLPFGTKIKIPALFGDQIFTVDDRMNQRYKCFTRGTKRCRMDIWLDTSRQEAKKFGVKYAAAEIYLPAPRQKLAAR